jgi:thiol-disulfide isomerase/thioredoxin
MRLVFLILFYCGSVSAQPNNSPAVDKRQIDFDKSIELIKRSPDSLTAVVRLNFYFPDLPYDTAVSYFKLLNPALANTKEYKQVGEKVKLGALSKVGIQVKNIPLKAPSGAILYLDTIASRHKLIVLDFWGSWCIPCRNNSAELKRLFTTYNAAGLTIIGVAIEEPDGKKWVKAIKDDGMNQWQHGLDSSKELQHKLGVSAVPTYVLIDKDMKILGRYSGRWIGIKALENAIQKHLQ